MAETEPAPTGEHASVAGRARKFLAACAQYASARLRLASLEGREAAAHGVKILLLAGAAIILAAFAWLFLCLAVVFLLSDAIGGPNAWLWATLVMAGLHLAGVSLLVLG